MQSGTASLFSLRYVNVNKAKTGLRNSPSLCPRSIPAHREGTWERKIAESRTGIPDSLGERGFRITYVIPRCLTARTKKQEVLCNESATAVTEDVVSLRAHLTTVYILSSFYRYYQTRYHSGRNRKMCFENRYRETPIIRLRLRLIARNLPLS